MKEEAKERNRRIKELRDEGWTLQNIGTHFAISRQRVSQILEKMKKPMNFSERARNKMQERGITASEFLDNLTEFLCDTEGLTTDELREDLEAKGLDTEKVLDNTEGMLRKYGFVKAADQMAAKKETKT